MTSPRCCHSLILAPLLLVLCGALALSACKARPAAMTGTAQTRTLTELAYGSDPAQRLDVYLPPDAQHAPVIVMVHGGAWRIGDKRNRAVVAHKVERWVPRGFVFVSINNRLLPDAGPLQQADDVAQALAYAQAQAPRWGADPDRLILMGHSAGAHLVGLLSADPAMAQRAGAHRWLGSVALDSAAFDLLPIMQAQHYGFYDKAFGSDPEYWRQASPIHRLRSAAVPMLAICSTERADSPCDQARAYAEKAEHLDVAVSVSPQAMSHRQINEDLGLDNAETAAVERFMASLDPEIARRLAR